jgi:hypothetical protein
MNWAAKYIGIPYVMSGRDASGVDCWGLICLVYLQEFGMDLPVIPGIPAAETLALCAAIEKEVKQDWTEVEKPFDACAVTMSQGEVMHHVGLWVAADGGKVMHCWGRHKVIADTVKGISLKGIRQMKFYRHRQWIQ